MNRLDPVEVANLFKKHNIIPRKCYLFSDQSGNQIATDTDYPNKKDKIKGCCGIGICLYDKGVYKSDSDWTDIPNILNIDRQYMVRFMVGFDSIITLFEDTEELSEGHKDGIKARELAFDAK